MMVPFSVSCRKYERKYSVLFGVGTPSLLYGSLRPPPTARFSAPRSINGYWQTVRETRQNAGRGWGVEIVNLRWTCIPSIQEE